MANLKFKIGEELSHVSSPDAIFLVLGTVVVSMQNGVEKKYLARQVVPEGSPNWPGIGMQLVEINEAEASSRNKLRDIPSPKADPVKFNVGDKVSHTMASGVTFLVAATIQIVTPYGVENKYLGRQIFPKESASWPGVSQNPVELYEMELEHCHS